MADSDNSRTLSAIARTDFISTTFAQVLATALAAGCNARSRFLSFVFLIKPEHLAR